MNIHFHSGFRDAASVCCLSYALSIQFYRFDGTSHCLRQSLHKAFEVVCAPGVGIIVMRHDRIGLLDRHIGNRRAAPAQEIDQLVASDGVYPRRQGLDGIIGMSLEVDREYRLLNQIFRLPLPNLVSLPL